MSFEQLLFQPDVLNVLEAPESVGARASVHIRVRQRNKKKSLTTIEGLPETTDFKKVLKVLRKKLSTNGALLEGEEAGKVLQLQGDQRHEVADFLVAAEICNKEDIHIHGF